LVRLHPPVEVSCGFEGVGERDAIEDEAGPLTGGKVPVSGVSGSDDWPRMGPTVSQEERLYGMMMSCTLAWPHMP
jgi:hypothetical protein